MVGLAFSGWCANARISLLVSLACLATQQANHVGACSAPLFWLFLFHAVPRSSAACAGNNPATLTTGTAAEEVLFEANVRTGAIVRLSQTDTAWPAMNVGQSHTLDCSQLHWGLTGPLRLQCNGVALTADMSGCQRVGCIWHRHALLPAAGPYLVTQGAEVDGGGIIQTGQWTSMVLAGNGAFYSPPMNAIGVLKIDAVSSAATLLDLVNLGSDAMKYSAAVLGPDGQIYAIPYSAQKVLRITPSTDTVSTIGSVFEQSYKWSHGVLAQDGRIYAIPAYARAVLRVDPANGETIEMTSDIDTSGAMKWSYGIVASAGLVFGIPSNSRSVLRIDPKLGTVSTFGDFGAMARKWSHGLLGVDGFIYAVPSSATAVLRINPATSTASVSLGAGLPADEFKWSMGVAASDGRIFCIPRSSQQVLLIDPTSSTTSLLGSVSSTNRWKWHHGTLAPDGLIYAVPSGANQVLRIDPRSNIVDEIGFDMGSSFQKYEVAALAPSGAIYAAPSSASRVLRLSPELDMCARTPLGLDVTCTLGMVCDVSLTSPAGMRGALSIANSLWISPAQDRCEERTYLEILGLTNPLSNSSVVAGSLDFAFGTGTEGAPSSMNRICWAPTSSSQHVVELGSFTLHGPDQNLLAHCVVGLICTITFTGVGLSLGSSLLVIPADETCGSNGTSIAAIPGLTNPHNLSGVDSQGDVPLVEHVLGLTRKGNAGLYSLCWAQSMAGNATAATAYLVPLGQMQLAGPELLGLADSMEPVVCWVGSVCAMNVAGVDLSVANRISVREECDTDSLATVAGLTATAIPDASGEAYILGTPQAGGGKLHVLCWHSSEFSPGVFFRRLQIYGTINSGFDFECIIGQPCDFQMNNSFFYGLPWALSVHNISLLLVPGVGERCPGHGASLWSGASNPAKPVDSSASFSLGVPSARNYASTQVLFGGYTICFSHDGEEFNMNVGILRILDTPCILPEPEHSISPPCESVDRIGAAVTVLSHLESCIPRCANDYSSTESKLMCQHGLLMPPVFECKKNCLHTPFVTNGNDHSVCAGIEHGSRCPLQCPGESVKSGDLECRNGRFWHIPGLSPELLFDVPRCYRGCNAQAAGCEAGAAWLRHGGTCNAVCADGSAPSVSTLTCIDGSVEPSFFSCSKVCAQAPSIPNSKGLAACAGTFPGAKCNLQCELGYISSGSPVCQGQDGTWTAERCIPPCKSPVVENAAAVPCYGLEILESGSFCEPMCEKHFTAEVEVAAAEVSDTHGPGLHCHEGVLTPATFVCRSSCMDKPEVEHAHAAMLSECRGTPHGESCRTPCLYGYRSSNDLECHDGVFSRASCLKECVEPPQVEFSDSNYACQLRGPGETCEVRCVPGYEPTGVAVCEEGVYSPVQCKPVCFAPPNIANAMLPSCVEGSSVESGQICTSHCAADFTPSISQLTCQDGVLRPPTFTCDKFCGVPKTIPHALRLSRCATLQVGLTCPVECAIGFKATGDLRCEADGWHRFLGQPLLKDRIHALIRGDLLGRVRTAPEFVLSFNIKLKSNANQHYQSVMHLSATGSNCCEVGDRVPAVFLAPALEGFTGTELHVFLDRGPGCLSKYKMTMGVKSHVVISLSNGHLQVSLDGFTICQEVYDQTVDAHRDVLVYGSSPWHEAADAEIGDVLYDPILLDDDTVQCVQVRCIDQLPAVPGAVAELASGSSCMGAVFNATCADIPCPVGTELSSRFVCDANGKWQPDQGVSVTCKRKSCPESLPTIPAMAANYVCASSKYGEVCAVRCQPGYGSSGAFSCSADSIWEQVPGAVPACLPLPCGEPPVVLRGVPREVCRNLPSDMLCEAQCVSGWKPFGEFRCSASLWIDVPICVESDLSAEASTGEMRAVVKVGIAAEPSSEILDNLGVPETWVSNVAKAAEDLLQHYLNKAVEIHILGSEGSVVGRRLQDNFTDTPGRWRADFVFLFVPDGNSAADAQDLYTSLDALTVEDFERRLLEALPGYARPQAVAVMLSAPRLAEIPASIAAALPTLMAQTTTKEPIVSTTTLVTVPTTTINISDANVNEQTGKEEVILNQTAKNQVTSWKEYVIWAGVPLAMLMSAFLFYKFLSHAKRYAQSIDGNDKRDFSYSIESWNDETVEDGLDPNDIFQHRLDKEARARQQNLEAQLAAVANPEKDAGEASAALSRGTTSHWDITNAKKLDESKYYEGKKKQPRRVGQNSMHLHLRVISKEGRRQERARLTRCQRCMKFTKRCLFVLFCGMKLQRELEMKKAKKTGRKARTFIDARGDKQSPRKSKAKAKENSTGKQLLVMAGVPSFIVNTIFSTPEKSADAKSLGILKPMTDKAIADEDAEPSPAEVVVESKDLQQSPPTTAREKDSRPAMAASLELAKEATGSTAVPDETMSELCKEATDTTAVDLPSTDKYSAPVAEEHTDGDTSRRSIPSGDQQLPPHDGEVEDAEAAPAEQNEGEKERIKISRMSQEEYELYQETIINDFFDYEPLDQEELWRRQRAMATGNEQVDNKAGNIVRIVKDQRIDFVNRELIERITTRYEIPKRLNVKRIIDPEADKAGAEQGSDDGTGSKGFSRVVTPKGDDDEEDSGDDEKVMADKLSSHSESEEGESSESESSEPDVILDDEDEEEEEDEDDANQEENEEVLGQELKRFSEQARQMGEVIQDDAQEEHKKHHHHRSPEHKATLEMANSVANSLHIEEEEAKVEPPTDPKILEAIELARTTDLYKEADVFARSNAAKAYWGIDQDNEESAVTKVADIMGLGGHGHHRGHGGWLGLHHIFGKFWCASPPTPASKSERV